MGNLADNDHSDHRSRTCRKCRPHTIKRWESEPTGTNFRIKQAAFNAWFFADSSTRGSPSLAISTLAYVQHRIREGTATALEAAYRADPGNALVVASLAAHSEDRARALFYCRYAQAKAGNNAEIWWAVAQILQKYGQTEQSLAAIDHALALRPDDINYAKFKALLVGHHQMRPPALNW